MCTATDLLLITKLSPRKLFIADNAVSNTGRVKQTNMKSVDKDMQVSPEKENYDS